ncbi:cytidine deaminase [bacterium]|nr:cytidine deaminase [bacterium]
MINTKLFDLAKEVAQQAYAPYSHFRVGAALITDTGNIYQGCNVENASYGLSICAERNAIFNMVANGDRIITEIAIYVDSDKIFPPCGACRQVLAEFGEDIIIYYGNDHQITETTMKEILPHTFRLK